MLPPTSFRPHSPQTRRERNRAEMREAILEAARAVMRQDGVAALNLNKVAAIVGVKAPSLYEYFDGKMALYDALFRRGMELFGERMNRVIATSGTWEDGLGAAIKTNMQFALDYPELYQLCFERPVPGFVPSAASMQVSLAMLGRAVAHVEHFMRQGGEWLGLTPAQVNDLGIAMIHGLTAQHLANEPHLPVGQGRYGSLIPAAIALFAAALKSAPDGAVRASARKLRARKKENRK